jgi:hypothetical protein
MQAQGQHAKRVIRAPRLTQAPTHEAGSLYDRKHDGVAWSRQVGCTMEMSAQRGYGVHTGFRQTLPLRSRFRSLLAAPGGFFFLWGPPDHLAEPMRASYRTRSERTHVARKSAMAHCGCAPLLS